MTNTGIFYNTVKTALLHVSHYSKQKLWLTLTVLLSCVGLNACSFQCQKTVELPQALQTVVLESSDPYGPLARALRRQLWLQHFNSVRKEQHNSSNPRLQIITSTENRAAISLFYAGKGAQYQITYRVQAQLHLAKHAPYLLNAAVRYTYFDNPMAALAKSSETEMIQDILCQQAARQLVLKMSHLLSQIAQNSTHTPCLPNTLSHHAPSVP